MASESSKNPLHIKNKNSNQKTFFLFIVLTILSLLGVVVSIFYLLEDVDQNRYFIGFLIFGLFLTIYSAGVSYTEYRAKEDFLKITRTGIEYHHSPKIFHGWLPKSGKLNFKKITGVNVLQIVSGLDILEQKVSSSQKESEFDLNEFINKPLLLEIKLKNGGYLRIGERLSPREIIQVAVLIESGAKLGQALSQAMEKFSEKYPNLTNTISNVMDSLSGLFRKKN
ncbi:MAG: hypothetical protein ACXAC7_02470 [Candidatus Hodarchaeales archaeon]